MGIWKSQSGNFYLWERCLVTNAVTGQLEWKWSPYRDYTLAVRLPRYLPDPGVGRVTSFAHYTDEFDYVAHDGHKNIGSWMDRAARRAGR